MTWARFDDNYSDHPKIVAAGALAELLDMRAIIYCARYGTDGQLHATALPRISTGIVKPLEKAAKLVDVGRWSPTGDGWEVLDFLDYNPSSADAEEAARARSEKAKRAAQARWHPPESNAASNTQASGASVLQDAPSRPVPSPSSSSHSSTTARGADVGTDEEKLSKIIDRLVEAKAAGKKLRNPARYKATVRNDALAEHGDTIRQILATHSDDVPAASVVGYLLGEQNRLADYRKG